MSFKGWFKSKPYWLKGGFVGIIIAFILALPAIICSFGIRSSGLTCAAFALPLYIPAYPTLFLSVLIEDYLFQILTAESAKTLHGIIFCSLMIITYFLYGTIIGCIVRKIKSRKIN